MKMKSVKKLEELDQILVNCYILNHKHFYTQYHIDATGFLWTYSFEGLVYWDIKFWNKEPRITPYTFDEMIYESNKTLYHGTQEIYAVLSLFQGYLIRREHGIST